MQELPKGGRRIIVVITKDDHNDGIFKNVIGEQQKPSHN